MSRTTLALYLLGLVLLGGAVVWYMVSSSAQLSPEPSPTATSTDEWNGQALYSNGHYGFSIMYPEAAKVDYFFSPDYRIGTEWRLAAEPQATGTPVVAFVTYHVEQDDAFPRRYTTQVRIGASNDADEVARCEEASDMRGESALPDTVINDRSWKTFALQNAGMMQYVEGVSYRTMHEGYCIALEKIRSGSNYREDLAGGDGIPEEVLTAEYDALSAIVSSFSFARP